MDNLIHEQPAPSSTETFPTVWIKAVNLPSYDQMQFQPSHWSLHWTVGSWHTSGWSDWAWWTLHSSSSQSELLARLCCKRNRNMALCTFVTHGLANAASPTGRSRLCLASKVTSHQQQALDVTPAGHKVSCSSTQAQAPFPLTTCTGDKSPTCKWLKGAGKTLINLKLNC